MPKHTEQPNNNKSLQQRTIVKLMPRGSHLHRVGQTELSLFYKVVMLLVSSIRASFNEAILIFLTVSSYYFVL